MPSSDDMKGDVEDDGFITVHPPIVQHHHHGSPYDRGDADAYYGRCPGPHKVVAGQRVEDLTRAEMKEYERGFEENPSDKKDWG